MSINSFNANTRVRSFLAMVVIAFMLATLVPISAIAEETPTPDGESGMIGGTTNSGEAGGNTESGTDGSRTEDGEGGDSGTTENDGNTGTTGEGAGGDGEDGDQIPVTSENDVLENSSEGTEGNNGTEADGGIDGSLGSEGAEGEDEDSTGGVVENNDQNAAVRTGDATARGELRTDANNNNVSSELTATTTQEDLDDYTFAATGTNEAIVENTGTTTALTGENTASSSMGTATVETGDAVSVLNIANILNTNVVNSDGIIHLLNTLMEAGESLDLRELFFPDPEGTLSGSATCSLISCFAEDIQYLIEHTNLAEIVNNALLTAVSGANTASGETAAVTTGDAYGSANILNIANTNIIDSNYLLLALNALGSLDGDLILPSADLFTAFFSQPNGLNQLEGIEDFFLNDQNTNNATTTNNLNTTAESGANMATTTAADALITTGNSNADSNIVNEINKNLVGGDSLYVMIRIHGTWSGKLFGLPEGLAWTQTPEGVLIYNEGAEIAPSQIVAFDVDSYTANFNNQNDVTIDNNITIDSLSGGNAIEGTTGTVATGDAYAGANVMNIANTNVIGRNWVMATMNIFGDLNGDISFGRPDLWVGGQVQSSDSPIGPGSKLTYTYTIKNNGDLKATNVGFTQELTSGYTFYAKNGEEVRGTTRRESLGTIRPGETIEVTYDAFVDDDIPYGTTNVEAVANLTSDEPENNDADNSETLSIVAERAAPPSNSGGGGGGGGGSPRDSSSRSGKVLGAKVDRELKDVDPNASPALTIEKSSDHDDKTVAAGTVVNYTITIENKGGVAYAAKVVDTLVNPIGSAMNVQSWDLGNILAGETIELTYAIKYDGNTPTGEYKNTARLIAYEEENDPGSLLPVDPAVHTIDISGQDLAIGNVEVVGVFTNGNGTSDALISWETTKPTDGQIFLSKQNGISPYDPLAFNYGYERASVYLPYHATKHYILVPNLTNGTQYVYRIRSANGSNTAFGGDYTLITPGTAPAPVAVARSTPVSGNFAPSRQSEPRTTSMERKFEPEPVSEPESGNSAPVNLEPYRTTATPTIGSSVRSVVGTMAGAVDSFFGFFGI